MDNRLLALALPAVLIAGIALTPAFGQVVNPVTVTLDKDTYEYGDIIMITGSVRENVGSDAVGILITAPNGNRIEVGQPDVREDKTFGLNVTAKGHNWGDEGAYTVKVSYSIGRDAEATFNFGGFDGVIDPPEKTVYPVDGTDFSLSYSITGGSITNIYPEVESTALVIEIETTDDGELTITLPRELIDNKVDGADADFIVLIDLAQEAEGVSETKTSTDRTLTIPFYNGAERIDIIGSFIIPEFGAIAMLILAAAVVAIIAVSARSRLSIMPRY